MATPERLGARVLTTAELARVMRLTGLLYVLGAATVAIAPIAAARLLANPAAHVGVCVVTAVVGVSAYALTAVADRIERAYPVLVHVLLLVATALTSTGLHFTGREFDVGALIYVFIAIFAFYLLRRPWAIAHLVVVGAGFGAVAASWGGELVVARWGFVMVALAAMGAVVGVTLERSDRLGAELAALNATLEHRVDEQVGEMARLGRLRRFLSPQVADAVLESDVLLEPHRRRIAVLFCDLRGFTRFTGNAEPEEVAEVLTAFYGVVGDLVRTYEATVGTFAGDGIMAYFNDPVPCEDPPGRALEMASGLREPMAGLLTRWERSGIRLGYGVGVAYGYATLGTIGFEGRYDYTAVGGVVNLAARLCDEAAPGEVLLDERAYDAVAARIGAAEPRELRLKGFAEPVRAFSVR